MAGDETPKNRPMWRLRCARGREKGCDARFPGYQSRFGDGHPNRRQCTASARSTGRRCRCDAVQGSSRCAKHGGHATAYRKARERYGHKFVSLTSGKSAARKTLAKLSTVEPYPKGVPWLASPVDRGMVIEASLNRELARGVWLEVTKQAAAKARGARGSLKIPVSEIKKSTDPDPDHRSGDGPDYAEFSPVSV